MVEQRAKEITGLTRPVRAYYFKVVATGRGD